MAAAALRRRSIVAALLLSTSAQAQGPSPGQIAGGILTVFAVMNECSISGEAGLRPALQDAGERLQAKFNLPEAALEAAAREAAHAAKGANCPQIASRIDQEGRRLIEQAAQALAR